MASACPVSTALTPSGSWELYEIGRVYVDHSEQVTCRDPITAGLRADDDTSTIEVFETSDVRASEQVDLLVVERENQPKP